MAQYADYSVTPNSWVDVHTALGIAAGTRIYVQNVGPVNVRVVTDTAAPTATNIGLNIREPIGGDAFTQIAQISPAAGEVAWMRAAGNLTEAIISVQD